MSVSSGKVTSDSSEEDTTLEDALLKVLNLINNNVTITFCGMQVEIDEKIGTMTVQDVSKMGKNTIIFILRANNVPFPTTYVLFYHKLLL